MAPRNSGAGCRYSAGIVSWRIHTAYTIKRTITVLIVGLQVLKNGQDGGQVRPATLKVARRIYPAAPPPRG